MNREIKFRAWSNLEKKMIQNPPLRYSYGKWIIEYADTIMTDIILSQFTGLLDKNGKEIYEGDIVYFERQEGVWSDQAEKNQIVKYPFICGNSHLGKVIGNIYEK